MTLRGLFPPETALVLDLRDGAHANRDIATIKTSRAKAHGQRQSLFTARTRESESAAKAIFAEALQRPTVNILKGGLIFCIASEGIIDAKDCPSF